MVLIVVLSVFGGFEKLVKDRVLSYTPHITLERITPWPTPEEDPVFNIEADWRAVEKSMSKLEGIESAYALVNDFILLDRNGAVAPASMQAIDTTNKSQLESLQELINPEDGTADMGLGETAVISSLTAEKFQIYIGDTIQIHTNRNLQQLQPAMERIGAESAWTTYTEELDTIISDMNAAIKPAGEQEAIAITAIENLYFNSLVTLQDRNLRTGEQEIIESVRDHLADSLERTTERPDSSGDYLFNKGHMHQAIKLLKTLATLDTKEEDISDIKNLKNVVLPKDLQVIGIYQATRHAYSPDVFVPLPTGQDLTGLGDGVRGIALRLDDPYYAAKVLDEIILPNMPENNAWRAKTWMEEHQQQFSLIRTQRQLLTFSLSFIMMVSAFSIMAVMFTVTIQKKREIGVMKALGAAPAQLVRVFLYQGIIIGFLGGLIGLGLGYLVIINRQLILDILASWGFDPFPSDFNGFDGLPAIIRTEEFIAVFLFAFVMCTLATLLPAVVASRSDAAKSLRNM